MDFRSPISLLGVPLVTESRTLTVTAPLTGGGTLSADRTLGLSYDTTLQVVGGALGVSSLVALAAHTHTSASIGAEIALGNPSVTGYVLSSDTTGVRSWVPPGAFSGILGASQGGTGVNNGANTLTVPATGTAALLNVAQTFTQTQTISAGLNVGTATGATAGQIRVPGMAGVPSILIAQNTGSPIIELKDGAATPNRWWLGQDTSGTSNGIFYIYDARQNKMALTIDTSQNTFLTGGLNVGNALFVNGNYTYAPGGPVSIDVQQAGSAAGWYGRIATRNMTTGGKSAFLGTYGASVAGVFAHNNDLTQWADIYVNTVDGSVGGHVHLPSTTYINGSLALHAGNYTSYAATAAHAHTVTWYTSTPNTGWSNYGNIYAPWGYCKDSHGIVHLRGLVTSDANGSSFFVELPVGYRPPVGIEIFTVSSSAGYHRVDVRSDGWIEIRGTWANVSFLSLSGITFPTVI